MDVVTELELIIKFAIHNAQPFAGSCQSLHFSFCLRPERTTSDRLKTGILTEGVEGVVEDDLFVLGFGMIDHCFHIVEPDFPGYTAG